MQASYEAPKDFVEIWRKKYPDYVSPYGARRRLQEGRELQGASNLG